MTKVNKRISATIHHKSYFSLFRILSHIKHYNNVNLTELSKGQIIEKY